MPDDRPPSVDPHATVLLHRLRTLQGLSREQLDDLPYGVIRVDRDGLVLAYNRTEADLAGKVADDVVGRNFFTDVAPCTDVREFSGRFRQAFERGEMRESFPFVFQLATGPLYVTISFCRAPGEDSAWILVDPVQG